MPEESTFRKYACPKLKLSRLLLDNLFLILVQNLPALEELNSKKHTPSPTVWFLRNCGIAQNFSCRIAQNLSFAKTVKGNFARNDFCEWFRKLLFFAQNWCAKKEKFCVSFRKNCVTVLRMETLYLLFTLYLKCLRTRALVKKSTVSPKWEACVR